MKSAIKSVGIIAFMALIVFSMAGCPSKFGGGAECNKCGGTGTCNGCSGRGKWGEPYIVEDARGPDIYVSICFFCDSQIFVPADFSHLVDDPRYPEALERYIDWNKTDKYIDIGNGKCGYCGGDGIKG